MKSDGAYEIGEQDRAYIEGLAAKPRAALLAIEAAAQPENIPILDRESGRVLAVLDVMTKQTKDISRVAGSNSQPSWAK